ncbi:non-specific serine/threonine protein kinase [Ranunculus cassubicifolius]
MITAYVHNGDIANARKLFDEMPHRNIATWNAMFTGYIRNNLRISEAYELFCQMPERNVVSYGAMITGFVRAGLLDKAEKVYNEMPKDERHPAGSNALMYGYLKIGKLEEAVRIFDSMAQRDVISWSSMIDGYCKKGRITEARVLFENMPERNVVSWTAMISGYMKSEKWEDGFLLFKQMRKEENVEINSTTLTVIFEACSNFIKLGEGIQVHGLVLLMGFDCDVFLGNSLITMYCRVGLMDSANKLFNMMGFDSVCCEKDSESCEEGLSAVGESCDG